MGIDDIVLNWIKKAESDLKMIQFAFRVNNVLKSI